jgi:hypothetical protein
MSNKHYFNILINIVLLHYMHNYLIANEIVHINQVWKHYQPGKRQSKLVCNISLIRFVVFVGLKWQFIMPSMRFTSTLLSNWPLAPLKIKLGNSLVCWLTINNTLGNWPLSATSTDANTVNNISLKWYIKYRSTVKFTS